MNEVAVWVRFSAVLGIFFVGQLITAVWWGGRLTNQVKNLGREMHSLSQQVEKLAQEAARVTACEIRIENLIERVRDLEKPA